MIRTILFITGMFIFHGAMCQQVDVNVHYLNKRNRPQSDTIYYSPSRKLAWDDFKGTPDPGHFGGAITASGFAYNADMAFEGSKIIMNIYVYTFFMKHDSWKKKEINGPYHLEHEQKHFDITYIGALNFVNELKKAKFTSQNYRKLPQQIFNKAYNENTAMQHQYDRETKHSINTEAQLAWNKKISELLETVITMNGQE